MRPSYFIALAVALLLGFWATGRADSALAPWGLNHGDCYRVVLTGSEVCGDAAQHIKATRAPLTSVTDPQVNANTQAELRSAIPSALAYYSDNGTYAGLTTAAMRDYNPRLSPDVAVGAASATRFCLQATHDGATYHFTGASTGPGGTIGPAPNGACP